MSPKPPNKPAPQPPVQLGLVATHYSGPLPTAEQLEHYEKLYNGAAKLFIDKFIEEQTHRHEIEKSDCAVNVKSADAYYEVVNKVEKFNFLGNISGQLLSAAICLAGLGACVYLAMNGHTWEAISVVAIPFAGIIRAMRSGKDGKKQ